MRAWLHDSGWPGVREGAGILLAALLDIRNIYR